jgi:hypothetical protein
MTRSGSRVCTAAAEDDCLISYSIASSAHPHDARVPCPLWLAEKAHRDVRHSTRAGSAG